MNIRFSHVATALLAIAAVVLMADRSWAIRYGLGPSKDEWGLKYEVAVQEAEGGKLTVVFTLADEGRLKPIYSVDVIAFSKQTDSQGGRAYDVKEPLKLKPTSDGKRAAEVQIPKDSVDRAMIRIITLHVDGKRQPSGGAYYDIPVSKYLKDSAAASSAAQSSRARRSADSSVE